MLPPGVGVDATGALSQAHCLASISRGPTKICRFKIPILYPKLLQCYSTIAQHPRCLVSRRDARELPAAIARRFSFG
jgi:hypothetical protein